MSSSNLNDTIYPSINMYLQSNEADVKKSNSNCIWYLNEKLYVPIGTRCIVSLVDFEMPYSFYNINDKNNILEIETTTGTEQIIIEPSNYDVEDIANVLNLKLANLVIELGTLIVITFNFNSNKFTFTSDTLDFTITQNTTINLEMGLSDNLPISSSLLRLTTPNVCNFGGTPYIQINTSLTIRNIDNKGNAYGVLSRIPVRAEPTQYIFHQATENQYFMLDDSKIESITIRLTDFKNEELQLNGQFFSLTIGVHFQYQRIPQNISRFKLRDAYNEIFRNNNNSEK